MNPIAYARVVDAQQELCKMYGVEYFPCNISAKLGISQDAIAGVLPLHGLRHAPAGETCGWYIWAGDYSEDPDFFKPMHVEHLLSDLAVVVRYLGLAPGSRFIFGQNGYEDVWFDSSLLYTDQT